MGSQLNQERGIEMNDNDIKLLQLIQEVKKGNKDVYDEISNLIIDEVYNLVSFVYKKEETRKKLARHVVVKIIRSIDEFDSEAMDIHMWIARFTTIEIYNVYSKQNGNIFNKTYNNLSYEYNTIQEDTLFEECAAEYNRAFIDIAELNKINGKLSSLTKAQKIIYEMFCYECFSIDEIEDVLEVDSTYIIDAIAGMREQLCAYLSQESSESTNSIDSADNINSTNNDIAISEEEAYELNNIYNNHSRSNHSKYYTIFSKKISKKSLISAASCAAVILLAVIVVVVVSIRDKNSVSNVANYGKMSTKSTTSKVQNTTAAASVNTKKDDTSTTQTETEEETEAPSTKDNSGNNQRPTTGNNTYVKPSSNAPNNRPQVSTNKPTVSNSDTEPNDEPDTQPDTKPNTQPDTQPNDEPGTKPNTQPDTQPSDEPDTQPDDEPDTQPDDEPDTQPDDNSDDNTKPQDNPDDTQKLNDNPDKTSNEDDSTQNEH